MEGQARESLPLERVLDTAEHFFSYKGYASVTLREIGQALGVSHASLYYHFPGGKEALFIAVTRRGILRHGEALRTRLEKAGNDIKAQLLEAAGWLLSQPPLDLIRMSQSDMPNIAPHEARKLMELMHEQVLLRLQNVLQQADEDRMIHCANPALVAGAIVGMVESFHSTPPFAIRGTLMDMAEEMIGILLRGLEYRGIEQTECGEKS
jgi:AcrR family transcriptional regulator